MFNAGAKSSAAESYVEFLFQEYERSDERPTLVSPTAIVENLEQNGAYGAERFESALRFWTPSDWLASS